MSATIGENVYREMLNNRQQAREQLMASLAMLPITDLYQRALDRDLNEIEGESAVQLIIRIVEYDYPELIEASTPMPRAGRGSVPGLRGDVQGGFTLNETTKTSDPFGLLPRVEASEYPHMQPKPKLVDDEYTVSVGMRLYANGVGYIETLDLDEVLTDVANKTRTCVISVPHDWFAEAYVKDIVRKVYRAALSGEPDNVIDVVNQVRNDQNWNDEGLHPDMTSDAILGDSVPDAEVAGYLPPVTETTQANPIVVTPAGYDPNNGQPPASWNPNS